MRTVWLKKCMCIFLGSIMWFTWEQLHHHHQWMEMEKKMLIKLQNWLIHKCCPPSFPGSSSSSSSSWSTSNCTKLAIWSNLCFWSVGTAKRVREYHWSTTTTMLLEASLPCLLTMKLLSYLVLSYCFCLFLCSISNFLLFFFLLLRET